MKLILKIFAGLVLLVFVAVGAAVFYLNDIVKEAVVKIGPEVTDTRVELQSVNLSLLNGSAGLEGLVIGNPEGFSEPNAFSLGAIDVELDTQTLTEPVILIHRVFVDAPEISYESTKAGDNFQALLANIEKNIGAGADETSETDSETAKKVIIEEFVLKDGSINVKHQLLAGKTINVPLPDLTLTDIGRKTNGATAQEAAAQIIKKITSSATGAITQSELLKQATQQLDELKDGVKDKVGEQLENLNLGGEQVDKVKDLFKGLKK